MEKQVFGIYRAQVVNNEDATKTGRIKCIIPDLFGQETVITCSLMLGLYKEVFMIPDVGDYVFVMFEAGDINRPVCVGSWLNQQSNISVESYEDGIELKNKHFYGLSIDAQKVELIIGSSRLSIGIDGVINLESATGSRVSIDNIGTISVESSGIVRISGSAQVVIESNAAVNINSTGVVTVTAPQINLG